MSAPICLVAPARQVSSFAGIARPAASLMFCNPPCHGHACRSAEFCGASWFMVRRSTAGRLRRQTFSLCRRRGMNATATDECYQHGGGRTDDAIAAGTGHLGLGDNALVPEPRFLHPNSPSEAIAQDAVEGVESALPSRPHIDGQQAAGLRRRTSC